MKNEVTQETELALRTLSKTINEREHTIAQLKTKLMDGVSSAYAEIILQGQDLIRCKAIIPHGLWLDWLAAHCPNISARTANRYMNRALNPTPLSDLRDGARLLVDKDDASESEPKRFPAPIEGVRRISQALEFAINKANLASWPEENKDAARRVFLPAVSVLWPDKFQ